MVNTTMRKFFMSPEGEVFSTKDLHEKLARQICEDAGWDWKSCSISAEEYLQECKGYVKVANYMYGEFPMRYISYSQKFDKNKRVVENAKLIAELLNLPIRVS